MTDTQKGLDPIAYLLYGENAQLRASAATRLQSLREDRIGAVENARATYRQKETQLLAAVLEWKQADADRSEKALEVGKLQKELANLDKERRNIEYTFRFQQQVNKKPPLFLGKQLQFSVADRTIPL